jgi:hypothetical protein
METLLIQPEPAQVLGASGIVECKRWGREFDAAGSGSRPGETAAQQIQRYLLIAGVESAEPVRWGMLTNGDDGSYRNTEVQQFGSIYERLLEPVPRRDDNDEVDVTISSYNQPERTWFLAASGG